jgi:hypothetical protein
MNSLAEAENLATLEEFSKNVLNFWDGVYNQIINKKSGSLIPKHKRLLKHIYNYFLVFVNLSIIKRMEFDYSFQC